MSLVRSIRMVAVVGVAAVGLFAATTSATAQRCNVDTGCSNGVKPNYWLPSTFAIGKGKAPGYITVGGQTFYGWYDWYDFVRPGGGIDRYCGFGGEQIVCPR